MARQLTSQRRAEAIGTSLFFLGLAIIAFRHSWWPSLSIVIGLSLAVRQFLLGRIYDMIVSLFIFIGIFVFSTYNIPWDILLPTIFVIAAIYTITREVFSRNTPSEVDYEENLNHELEEEEDHSDTKN